jgi:hypothetical protein
MTCPQMPKDQHGILGQKQLHAILQIYFSAPLSGGKDAALLDIHSFFGFFPGLRRIVKLMIRGIPDVATDQSENSERWLLVIWILSGGFCTASGCESNSNGEEQRKERPGEIHGCPP